MSDLNCSIYNSYEIEATKITADLNRSQNLQEKAQLAQKLINLEAELTLCEEKDDPNCRIQRKNVVPVRRKTAETILKLAEARKLKL